MARSSLLSSIVLILAVFIVMMFAITDIENTALRKPFSPNIFNQDQTETKKPLQQDIPEPSSTDNKPPPETVPDPQAATDSPLSTTISTNTADLTNIKNTVIYPDEVNSASPDILKNSPENPAYDLNFENFKKAGLNNLLLQRKPFNGTIFEGFEINELATLEVNQQSILTKIENTTLQTTIIESWEFKTEDITMAKEIYELLRSKFAGSLGSSVKETNQFGQQSFYVNFEGKDQNVFLVVKQYNSVYALSYLKGYHDLIKALFKLI